MKGKNLSLESDIIGYEIKLLDLESICLDHLPRKDVEYLKYEVSSTRFKLKKLKGYNQLSTISI